MHLKVTPLAEEAQQKEDNLYNVIPMTGQKMQGNFYSDTTQIIRVWG